MNNKLLVNQEDFERKNNANANKKPQFISVIAYVHNDEENIENFVNVVMSFCQTTFKQCELIFVDDYSTDNSVKVIKEYFEKNPSDYIVSIIRMGRYHGMEISMNAGRDMSVGDYVYEFDSLFVDFDDSVINEAHEKCLEGNDIVTVATNVPLRVTSKIFYKVFNMVSNSHMKIGQETFRLLSRRGINRITSMDVNIPYRKAIYLNSGLSTAQINYKSNVGERPPRITKKYERFNLALDSFIYFTNLIERMALGTTILMGLLSIFIILFTNAYRLDGNQGGSVLLMIVIFVSIAVIGLFSMIVFIIKYLSVLIKLVFKNQEYLIEDVDKISWK